MNSDKATKLARLVLGTRHDGEAIAAGLALARMVVANKLEDEPKAKPRTKPKSKAKSKAKPQDFDEHEGYCTVWGFRCGPMTEKAALMRIRKESDTLFTEKWVPFSQMFDIDVDVVKTQKIGGDEFALEVTQWYEKKI